MSKALLAALLIGATASAQTPADAAKPGDKPAVTPSVTDVESLRREMDAKVAQAKKEMLDELRAQLATKSVAEGWQEEWTEEKRKLELFTLDGYFRVRPDLFNKFDLNREPDLDGYQLWPRSPASTGAGFERTQAGVNMRLRLEPTLNVSEEVRVRMQVDALDNVIMGSTPDYAFTRSDQQEFGVFSESQAPPVSGINSLQSSIAVKRIYGEVSTPVGILRFGRMGSHWGLGMLHNDGNCQDCDHGDTVDRLQFVAEPFAGWYVTPMIDFNSEGPSSQYPWLSQDPTGGQLNQPGLQGQPYDLSNADDSHSYVIAVARRDTEQQAKAKLENGQDVFNFGLHFEYRTQKDDPVGWFGNTVTSTIQNAINPTQPLQNTYVWRNAQLWIPDLWAKYERKAFRVEAEVAGVFGSIGNRSLDPTNADTALTLSIAQFGGVVQGEYRFLDGKLHVGGEVGFASGDPAPGLGNHPGRRFKRGSGGNTTDPVPGDFDGHQYDSTCQSGSSPCDSSITNFQFNADYRIDLILWREILGRITDAIYVKPTASYDVAEGLKIFGSAIYSRTVFAASSPNGADPNLGVELDAGARYETEDGFIAQLQYGILFPMTGLTKNTGGSPQGTPPLDNAQAVRGWIGIKF